MIKHFFSDFQAGKGGAIFLATLSGLGVTGLVLALVVLISNILSLGTTQLQDIGVQLSIVDPLPASIYQDKEERVRFDILENTGAGYLNTTLKVRLTAAGQTLLDPSIVTMTYQDPGIALAEVALTSVGGNLEGNLKSAWDIPAAYSEEGELFVTFTSANNPPIASYSAEVWVERDDGTVVGTTHDVTATSAGDVFSPEAVAITAGDAVRWTSVGSHEITFDNETNPAAITGTNLLGDGLTHQETFLTPGVYQYRCEFHSSDFNTGMVGTITVNP